jgi:hypothetical protein
MPVIGGFFSTANALIVTPHKVNLRVNYNLNEVDISSFKFHSSLFALPAMQVAVYLFEIQ